MVLDFAFAHHHLELLNPLIVVFKLGFVLLLTFSFPDHITLAVHVLVLRKRLRIWVGIIWPSLYIFVSQKACFLLLHVLRLLDQVSLHLGSLVDPRALWDLTKSTNSLQVCRILFSFRLSSGELLIGRHTQTLALQPGIHSGFSIAFFDHRLQTGNFHGDFLDQSGFDVAPGIRRLQFPVLDEGEGLQLVQPVHDPIVVKSQLDACRLLLLRWPFIRLHVLFNHVTDSGLEIEYIVVINSGRFQIVKHLVTRQLVPVLDSWGEDSDGLCKAIHFELFLARK